MKMAPLTALLLAATACDRGVSRADTTAASADSLQVQPPSGAPGTPSAASDQSALLVILEPVEDGNTPAELVVRDPSGRRVGRDSRTGFSMSEIRGATYDSLPSATADPSSTSLAKHLTVPALIEGPYEILVVGTRTGPFTLGVELTMPDGGRRAVALQGHRIERNQTRSFRFDYARSDTGAIALRP